MYVKSIEEIYKELDSSASGLSDSVAAARLKENGRNEVVQNKKESFFSIFFKSFKDAMILILLGATILSLVLGEYIDAALILFIVVVNAVIATVQELNAIKSVESLKEISNPKCIVRRAGKKVEIDTRELVLGDIVVLEAGDVIPADGRLIESVNLKVNESLLTGENELIHKDKDFVVDENAPVSKRLNTVYSSTYVAFGRGEFIVTKTGMDTEIGKIAFMIVEDKEESTPLQEKLNSVGKMIASVVFLVALMILVIGIYQNRSFNEMIFTSISIAVAAIPEGLPTIVSILLAMGVKKLASKKAIVKGLSSVETLGSSSVICTDKTGTLTENNMVVVSAQKGIDEKELAIGMSLCNDSEPKKSDEKIIGDPTEIALISYANSKGFSKEDLDERYKRVMELPFDSSRKCMSTLHEKEGKYIQYTKGAIESILDKCNYYILNDKKYELSNSKKEELISESDALSSKAMRVLALATRAYSSKPDEIEENSMTFIGFLAMMDPARKEAKYAVNSCKTAGIVPVMITGDNLNTAVAIATQIELFDPQKHVAITGAELDKLDDNQLDEQIENIRVFARTVPEQKVRIVNAWQKKGKIVAMSGDGINDAPAIKRAEIGVAMGEGGTDVSREVADLVLMDDNFATIVAAVEEGRGIYENIRRTIRYLISCNLGEVLLILTALLMLLPLPLLPIHLLWINLVSDGMPAIALGFEKRDNDTMKRKPRSKQEPFFSRKILSLLSFEAIVIAALSFVAFIIGMKKDIVTARTMVFMTLAFAQLVHGMNVRSANSLFEKGFFTNSYYLLVIVLSIAIQLTIMFVPQLNRIFKLAPSLSLKMWAIIVGLSIVPLIVTEIRKRMIKG